MYQISLKSDNFSLRYGDLTIFKMAAAVHHLGFKKFAFFVMQPVSACRSASSYKISLKSDNRSMNYCQKKRFSKWRPPPSWILKFSTFGHVAAIWFIICCSVPNVIKIRRFYTEIWWFNDFKNGGLPPSLIFLVQNFAEIGQSVDELWPKKVTFKMAAAAILNFKYFNLWSRDCHRVQYLL